MGFIFLSNHAEQSIVQIEREAHFYSECHRFYEIVERHGFLRTSMQQAKASRLSDIPAIMPAIHQANDSEPKILRDYVAPKLLNFAA